MNDFQDEEKIVTAWCKAFRAGTDYDLWGQPVEAIDQYRGYYKCILYHRIIYKYTDTDSFSWRISSVLVVYPSML